MEARFSQVAPDHFAAFTAEEDGARGRSGPTRTNTAGTMTDPSILAKPPNAYLIGDRMGSIAYIGIGLFYRFTDIARTFLALDLLTRYP